MKITKINTKYDRLIKNFKIIHEHTISGVSSLFKSQLRNLITSSSNFNFEQNYILILTYTILTFIIIFEESFHIHFIPLTSLLKINSI